MSIKVIEEIKHCKHCNMETLQRKNAKRISWLMHLVLTIFTAGLWIIPFVFIMFFHTFSKMDTALGNNWVCTQCNNKPLFGGR